MSLNIFLLINNSTFKKVTTIPEETIDKLIRIVIAEFNLKQLVKLKYKGEILNSSKTIFDYGISDCSVIHIVKFNRLKMVNLRHKIFKKVVLITKVLLKFNPNCFEHIMKAIDNVNPEISDLICKKENYFIKMITKPLNKKELGKFFKKQTHNINNNKNKNDLNKQVERINPFQFMPNKNENLNTPYINIQNSSNDLYTPIFEEFITKMQYNSEINNLNSQNQFHELNFLNNYDENNFQISNEVIDDIFKRNQVGIESLFNFNKINDRKNGIFENNLNYFDFGNI